VKSHDSKVISRSRRGDCGVVGNLASVGRRDLRCHLMVREGARCDVCQKRSMAAQPSVRTADHFVALADLRRRNVTYLLITMVTIALCAVICGAGDFVSIAGYDRKQRKWLAQLFDFRRGIPAHDRFHPIPRPSRRRSPKLAC